LQYVQANGLLGDVPVYQTPAQWGTISVHGDNLIPGTSFLIRADCGATPGDVLSDPVAVTTWKWGDVNKDSKADIADTLRVVDGFLGIFFRRATPCTSNAQCTDPLLDAPFYKCNTTEGFCVSATLHSADLINANPGSFGCRPDGNVDLADVLRSVDAFLGFNIPCAAPCP